MKKSILKQFLAALIAAAVAFLIQLAVPGLSWGSLGLAGVILNVIRYFLAAVSGYLIAVGLIGREDLDVGRMLLSSIAGAVSAALLTWLANRLLIFGWVVPKGIAMEVFYPVRKAVSLLLYFLCCFLSGFIYFTKKRTEVPFMNENYTAPQAPAYPPQAPAVEQPAAPEAPAYPYGQAPYGAPQAPYAQAPYGAPQAPYGQAPYGAPQAPYGQASYGAQAPYGQAPYGGPQAPYGQAPGYSAPQVPVEDLDGLHAALLYAVRPQLKAPMSAVLCPKEQLTIRQNGNAYEVEGIVHSQNSYGAMIATDFTATAVRSNGFWSVIKTTVGLKNAKNYAKNFAVNYIAISIFVGVMALIGSAILFAIVGL